MLPIKANRGSSADNYFQDKMSMTSSQNESDSGYRYSACFGGRKKPKTCKKKFLVDLIHCRNVKISQRLCLSHLYLYSNSVCSVTSGSPHSQEGNLDTEVFVSIMELYNIGWILFCLKNIVGRNVFFVQLSNIDFETSVWQAGPDIGDMELRRSMLEPEVAGHLQQLTT